MPRLTAGATVLALLAGFLLAPYSHVHLADAGDGHHSHDSSRSVKHAHLDGHVRVSGPVTQSLDHGRNTDDSPSIVISSNDFIFRAPEAPTHTSPAARVAQLLEQALEPGQPMESWAQPPAHGPPPGRRTASRAPPAFLPAV